MLSLIVNLTIRKKKHNAHKLYAKRTKNNRKRKLNDLIKSSNSLLGSIIKVICRNDLQTTIIEDLLANLNIGALKTDNERKVQLDLLDRLHDALSNHITTNNTTKDIDENGLHMLIGTKDLESLDDLLDGGMRKKHA